MTYKKWQWKTIWKEENLNDKFSYYMRSLFCNLIYYVLVNDNNTLYIFENTFAISVVIVARFDCFQIHILMARSTISFIGINVFILSWFFFFYFHSNNISKLITQKIHQMISITYVRVKVCKKNLSLEWLHILCNGTKIRQWNKVWKKFFFVINQCQFH